MGVFSKLFGKGSKESKMDYNMVQNQDENRVPRMQYTREGNIAFEIDTPPRERRNGIVILKNPEIVMGRVLYDCYVSYYKESDMQLIEAIDTPFGRGNYEMDDHVIAGVDLNRMMNDAEYLKYAAKQFFNKERIEKYLNTSKMSAQEIAEKNSNLGPNDRQYVECGRYIGELQEDENGRVRKIFMAQIGSILHNSAEMIAIRNSERERAERIAKAEELERQARKLRGDDNYDRLYQVDTFGNPLNQYENER